jgi:hypothetical protein
MDEVNEMEAILEEPSESTNAEEEADITKKPQSDSALSLGTVESVETTAPASIAEEDISKAREELKKNLHEEQMLMNLQMQLLLQLDKLNASIASAESDERIAKIAFQQAQVIRLIKKTQDPSSNVDDETIAIKLRR